MVYGAKYKILCLKSKIYLTVYGTYLIKHSIRNTGGSRVDSEEGGSAALHVLIIVSQPVLPVLLQELLATVAATRF